MCVAFSDIRSAYLKADLDVKLFMSPPKGVEPPEPGQVMRLDKALYGSKQAGRQWHQKFKGELLNWGFQVSHADPCLFISCLLSFLPVFPYRPSLHCSQLLYN